MPTLATTDSTWVNDATVSYDAAELRRADAALFSSGGVASGLAVSVDASDVVTVTSGRWVIDGDSTVTGTGVYRGGIGASASVALDARDATNSRIDLVVARQYDPDVVPAHTESAGKIEVITGTPAASPTAPALPDLAVELARITVPASGGAAASVDNSNRTSATTRVAEEGVARGKFSGTISGGTADVAHGLGVVPTWASITGINGAIYRIADASNTSTILAVRVRESGATTDNWSGSISFYWEARA